MLESCPRCSAPLGAPLASGRQVCSQCGWSTVINPPPPKISQPVAAKSPPKTGLVGVFILVFRVIGRFFNYIFLIVKQKFTSLFQARPGARQNLFQGLSERLQNLEAAIPTATDLQERPWLDIMAAFEELGGVPGDETSRIQTRDGRVNVSFAQFRSLDNPEAYKRFGLECDLERDRQGKPYLRRLRNPPA